MLGLQKKPKNVQEGLGLENTGGVVPAARPPLASMVQGAMGSLTDQVMQQKRAAGELGTPQTNALFNQKKKKKPGEPETGAFGQQPQ